MLEEWLGGVLPLGQIRLAAVAAALVSGSDEECGKSPSGGGKMGVVCGRSRSSTRGDLNTALVGGRTSSAESGSARLVAVRCVKPLRCAGGKRAEVGSPRRRAEAPAGGGVWKASLCLGVSCGEVKNDGTATDGVMTSNWGRIAGWPSRPEAIFEGELHRRCSGSPFGRHRLSGEPMRSFEYSLPVSEVRVGVTRPEK